MVEGMFGGWPLGFSEILGKAKVTESGAGRVNSERWEVFVRTIFVFCGKACRDSRRAVVEDETIVFSGRRTSKLKGSHRLNRTLYS